MSDTDTPTTEKGDQPQSKGKHFVEQLNAYRNIILAVTALATATGSWFKPTDTSATKQSFDWTTKKMEELSKNDVQMHDDIVALRAYLEGMRSASIHSAPTGQVDKSNEPPEANVGVVTVEPERAPARASRRSGGIRQHDPMPQQMVEESHLMMMDVSHQMVEPPPIELPSLKADPHRMERPSFEDVAFTDE